MFSFGFPEMGGRENAGDQRPPIATRSLLPIQAGKGRLLLRSEMKEDGRQVLRTDIWPLNDQPTEAGSSVAPCRIRCFSSQQ